MTAWQPLKLVLLLPMVSHLVLQRTQRLLPPVVQPKAAVGARPLHFAAMQLQWPSQCLRAASQPMVHWLHWLVLPVLLIGNRTVQLLPGKEQRLALHGAQRHMQRLAVLLLAMVL